MIHTRSLHWCSVSLSRSLECVMYRITCLERFNINDIQYTNTCILCRTSCFALTHSYHSISVLMMMMMYEFVYVYVSATALYTHHETHCSLNTIRFTEPKPIHTGLYRQRTPLLVFHCVRISSQNLTFELLGCNP